MNERIKILRNTLKLTQQEFSDRLGVKRNTIAMYEMGRNLPSNQTIISICREFNVNETWLRSGEGEMFNPQPHDDLFDIVKTFGLSKAEYLLLKKFVSLSDRQRKAVIDFITDYVAELNAEEKHSDKEREPTPEELHAELDRQLDLQKEAREKL